MELIVSHNNVDFDGLASMVAAQKLFPKALMFFAGKPKRNVQEFLALYKDSFDIKNYRNLALDTVTKLIIVDTKNAKRLGSLQDVAHRNTVEKVIYDHHPEARDDLKAHLVISEQIGAATTLLVEQLIKNKIKINSFEATLFTLGIYEDTGSLCFSTTSVRDVKAVAWLLEQGANLKVVRNYMERPLSEEQQELLNILIRESHVYSYNGIKILVSSASLPEYIGGLDLLTHKMREITGHDIVFTAVRMDDRIHIVGRSNMDSVQVNAILAGFGGSGHEKAGAATVKDLSLDDVLSKLHQLLQKHIKPEITARQIMSSPVKTVDLNQSINDTGKIMLRYGHTGFPVIDNEIMVGIISRRDVEKAKYHGLGHAPVKGFMSRNVVNINPDTPLSQIEQLMVERDIGRLPVIEDGRLLGIISRTDVLRVLYGSSVPPHFHTKFWGNCSEDVRQNLFFKMPSVFSRQVFNLIKEIGFLADRESFRVYLVGGVVRDFLLGLQNMDLDIVVEGDGLAFAHILAQAFQAKACSHEKFATAAILLEDGLKIDIASARTEYYEYPAALPTVETGSLKQDLYRRDFTINAMAIGLNQDNLGQLFDFFCGESDLKQGIIRILYNLSFHEDPTRIFRAVRFAERYGFEIEFETRKLAVQAVEQGLMEKLSFSRIREELFLILKEKNLLAMLERLEQIGAWKRIFPEFPLSEEVKDLLKTVPQTLQGIWDIFPLIDVQLVLLLVLFHHCSEAQVGTFNERFQWSKSYRKTITKTVENKAAVLQGLKSRHLPPSTIHRLMGELPEEAIVYFYLVGDHRQKQAIKNYLAARKKMVISINGEDLKYLGLKPSPQYRDLLDRIKEGRLDGRITSREEEITYIKELIQHERGD